MTKLFHNTHKHEPSYYEAVLRILIACNADAMSYGAMADKLNAESLRTTTGQTWTAEHVKQTLKKLRAYKTYPSRIHQHLLELIFQGDLTMKEAMPLYKSRRHGIQ